jgi:hypothetical protein
LIRTSIIMCSAISLLGAYYFPRSRQAVFVLVLIVCLAELLAPALFPARGG